MLSAVTSLWCVSFVICHCAWATKLASPLGTTTIQPNIYQIKQGDQHVMYHYINDPENKVETESFAENKTLPHWTQWNWLPYIAALFVGIWAQCSSRATAIMETAGCWNQRTSWPVVENAFPELFFGTLITASDWLIRRDFTVVILQTAALYCLNATRGSLCAYSFETGQLPGAPLLLPSAELLLCSPAARRHHHHACPTPHKGAGDWTRPIEALQMCHKSPSNHGWCHREGSLENWLYECDGSNNMTKKERGL